jgi:tetratricopeptide (TPR) repeat protein
MDARTDVYSLGATLYAVVLGRPPFQEDSVLETVQSVVASEPPAPRKLNPRLHRDVETILLKALRKTPAQRYATAADLAADLDRFLAGEPIEARPLSAPVRLLHRLRRRPWVAATLLAILLGLGVSGGLLLRQRGQETRVRQAQMTLDEAGRKLDEWDRLIYLPPRDLTPHHALLEDALRLAREARSRIPRRLPLAAMFEARALVRLRREGEAEAVLDEALRSGADGRLHLARAQVRLQRLIGQLMDPSRLNSANWSMFAGTPVLAIQESVRRGAVEGIVADLEAARRLGGDVGFEAGYLAAVEPAFQGDFARAEEASRSLLQRSSPWEQAELLRLLAWAQYFQFLKEAPTLDFARSDLAGSPHLRGAREHISRALEVRRSDADFHLFRAFLCDLEATQLLSALQAHPVLDFPRNCQVLRSRLAEHGARITREQREALARASSDVDTALVIRPGDPDALLLRASALFGSIRLDDWLTINEPETGDVILPPARLRGVAQLVRRVIRESIDPAEAACKALLDTAPENSLAWLHLALFRWQRANMLRLTGNVDAYMPAIEAATRALALPQEAAGEAFLRFMRCMAWGILYRAHGKAHASERTAALADVEKIRRISPELAQVVLWIVEGN